MTDLKQSWKKCRYSIGAITEPQNRSSKLVSKLGENGLFEVYGCYNGHISRIGAYPKEIIWIEDGEEPLKFSRQNSSIIFELEDFVNIKLGKHFKEVLKEQIERGTAACRHCRFYEPDNQTG